MLRTVRSTGVAIRNRRHRSSLCLSVCDRGQLFHGFWKLRYPGTAAHANMADEGEEVVDDTEWEVPDEQLTAEEVFIKYDTDHSGAIDMDEFKVRVRHTVLEQSRSGWYW